MNFALNEILYFNVTSTLSLPTNKNPSWKLTTGNQWG